MSIRHHTYTSNLVYRKGHTHTFEVHKEENKIHLRILIEYSMGDGLCLTQHIGPSHTEIN